jgi:hypothetical protein
MLYVLLGMLCVLLGMLYVLLVYAVRMCSVLQIMDLLDIIFVYFEGLMHSLSI